MERLQRWLPTGVLAVSLVLLLVGGAGGRGWEHMAGAVLGALTLAGVVAAVGALLPKDPFVGVIAAAMLILAPPFRDAAAVATPALLAACGLVWAITAAAEYARSRSVSYAGLAFAAVVAVIVGAPWLGIAIALMIVGWLTRASALEYLAIVAVVIGAMVLGWWFGRLPAIAFDLTAMVVASGRGAAAIVVGAGLLGTAFATATALPLARWLALATAITTLHAIAIDPEPAPLLAVLAIGIAVIPSGIARAVPFSRTWVGLVAGLPLIAVALATGH